MEAKKEKRDSRPPDPRKLSSASGVEKGKKLTTRNIVGLGLGGAIGSGIFLLMGIGIADTGRSILPVVVIGCLFMLLAYWYQFVMPMMFVFEGGDYSMRTMIFGPLLTGCAGWMSILGGLAMAGYSVAITNYLEAVIPSVANMRVFVSIVVATIFFLITIRGSRVVTIVENLITVALVISLALFVIFGLPKVDPAAFFSSADGGFLRNGLSGFVAAIAIMSWACQGTTMGPVAMGPVTENPKRTIPVSIIYVTLFLAIIYGLMAYVAAGVLPFDQIAGKGLDVTAKVIFPDWMYVVFVVGGGIGAIASSLMGTLAGVRYPLIRVAEDGWLPAIFKKTLSNGYPYMTYLVYYLFTVIPLILGIDIGSAVSLVMIPSMLFNLYMNFSCLTLPKRYPKQWEHRSLKLPLWLYNIGSALGGLCAALVAVMLFKGLTPVTAGICLVIILCMVCFSTLALKTGSVNKEALLERKKEAARLAMLEGEMNLNG